MPDKTVISRLASLTPEKRDLLRKLLDSKARTIQPRQPGERVPLTYGQARLWVVDQIAEQNPAYNECNFIRFPYAINVGLFRQAVNEVIRRHEALRTLVEVRDGELFQKVLQSVVLNLPLVDLRRFPIEVRESEALRLAAEEGRVPVSLTEGPLIRGTLYRLADDDFLFTLMLHHIICDGWSMGVMAVEISALYWSFMADKPSPLPPLKLQYPDFAIWQRKSLNDTVLASQLDYWRTELADLPTLDLPAARPRPRQFTYRGGRCPLEIPKTLYASLLKLCEREQVTPQILLLTVFNILLHRYSGQDDITVITPVAGRNRKELEPLIGFLVNSLVVRTHLSGNPTFVGLLARVREKSVAALANQDVPFERLIEELKPVRDKSRNPIAQVAFQIFQPPSVPNLDPKFVFPFLPVDTGISKFDLTLQLILSKESLRGHIEYYADFYDASQIEQMGIHFCRLLESAVTDSHQRISELTMLSSDEERRQLVDWNDTRADYPRDSNIPEVFQSEVAAHSQKIAVRYEDLSLTYGELDRSANSIAGRLAASGLQKRETVGLLMDRSFEFIVALLGITKAGGISVPLDLRDPSERLSYLVADSGANILLTSRSLFELAGSLGKHVLIVEEIMEGAAAPSNVNVEIEPADVACLMYISGATGRPNGVAITHRNIVKLVKGVNYVSISDNDVIAQIGSISFDGSLFEIWGALLNGATVAVYPPGTPSLSELGAFIRNSEISLLLITTAQFRHMIESNASDLRSVRQLITGGEPMPPALATAAFKNLPRTKLFNAYGPTECTTFASIYLMTNIAAIGDNVPIGRPVKNTAIYILDADANLLPAGAVGEICIGGDGVARGYWNHPDLTARYFVADPFSGGRMYRTGDLGKYRADGNILFVGRRDRQVKLSGYRIELGEIETTIATHPGVTGVAVMLTDAADEPRLTVFLEVVAGSSLTYAQLREFLSRTLPSYLIHSQMEIVDELPLTANGKVDYVALSKRPRPSDVARDEYVTPRTRTEHLLVDLWQEVLAADRVRVTDNFFDLGGHSLVATRLLSRVRETFQTEITMGQFFDNPTVAGLAAIISANGKARAV